MPNNNAKYPGGNRMPAMRFLTAIFGCFTMALGSGLVAPTVLPAQDTPSDLKIVVLEGEDGVNILKKKTAVMPVVEVRDKNNLPVSGATVIFAAPRSGASAVFSNGSRTISVVTDSSGRATVTSMKPVDTGAFKIDVTASEPSHGTAKTTIAQTNVLTAAAAAAAAAGGGSAAGAGAAAHHGAVVAGVVVAAGVGVASAVLAAEGGGTHESCLSGCK